MEESPEGQRPGAIVRQVQPGLSAEALGLLPGDLIITAGRRPVRGPADVAAYSGQAVAGQALELQVLRAGRQLRLRGTARGRPFEVYDGATAHYGSVPFDGGRIRDILVMPNGVSDPPVLFILQGFNCVTMEVPDPDAGYRRIAQTLARRGIATYRVEKPGVGDSVAGRQHCLDMNFARELDAFRTAYTHLVETRGFDQDRVFMFGHSMGGIQSPLLAVERAPRGVAVFGTVLRNWADYHLALNTFQAFVAMGGDPAEQMRTAERNREMFRRFYFDRETPAQIAAALPASEEALRRTLGWDGGEQAMGRHYSFMQDLAQLRLGDAWKDTRSRVLAMHGEADVAALFNSDHWLIAEIANHYRPGTGRFVEFAGTDHGFTVVGSLQEVRARTLAEGFPPRGEFNEEIAAVLIDWIADSLSRPPVRSVDAASPIAQ